MSADRLIALFVIGFLVFSIGLAQPPQQTATAETCTDGYWVDGTYIESNCVEGSTTVPNPTRGYLMGFGILVILIGAIGALIRSHDSQQTPPAARTPQDGMRLEVSGAVIDAETGEHTKVKLEVRATNTADAKSKFESQCVDNGYVVDGDVEIDVIQQADQANHHSNPPSATETGSKTPTLLPYLQKLDQQYWKRAIEGGTALWTAVVVLPLVSLLGSTLYGIVYLTASLFVVITPIAIYADATAIDEQTTWTPKTSVLAALAFLPTINIIVGGYYLLRRHYAVQDRTFSLSNLKTDLGKTLQRARNTL